MKYNLKRLLALLMALMLAVPSFAFAEDTDLPLEGDSGYNTFYEEGAEEMDETPLSDFEEEDLPPDDGLGIDDDAPLSAAFNEAQD